MAYSATVTVNSGMAVEGQQCFVVSISETEGAASSEATIEGVPQYGRVIRQIVSKSSGSATTFTPVIGTATNPSGANVALLGTAEAAPDNTSETATYYSASGTLYHRSAPDAGTDNTTTVVYHIIEGW